VGNWPYSTARWQKLRRLKLSADPLCFACQLRGKTVPASHVDHIQAIAKGGEPFPPLDELMSLCPSCHSEKTAAIDRGQSLPGARRFKGFDVDGNPIDPDDAWFGSERK
jgi:5-methylcytosine-specific restriction endonuclease McrA